MIHPIYDIITNKNSDNSKCLINFLKNQSIDEDPYHNTSSNQMKNDNSKFFVFGKNSQHYSLKKSDRDKNENDNNFNNKYKKKIYNSLTNHIFFTEKTKQNIEKKKLENIKNSANARLLSVEKNENILNKEDSIENNYMLKEEKNTLSYKFNKKEIFQINNEIVKINIKPKLNPIKKNRFKSKEQLNTFMNTNDYNIYNSNKNNNLHFQENNVFNNENISIDNNYVYKNFFTQENFNMEFHLEEKSTYVNIVDNFTEKK